MFIFSPFQTTFKISIFFNSSFYQICVFFVQLSRSKMKVISFNFSNIFQAFNRGRNLSTSEFNSFAKGRFWSRVSCSTIGIVPSRIQKLAGTIVSHQAVTRRLRKWKWTRINETSKLQSLILTDYHRMWRYISDFS